MKITISDFKKSPSTMELPEWVNTPTKHTLYIKSVEIFEDILQKIKNGRAAGTRDTRIVSRQIALACKLSPSIINKRRQPEIVTFLASLNDTLALEINSHLAKQHTSGKKQKKDSISEENTLLKSQIKYLENLRLSEALTTAINLDLTENNRNLVSTISKLKEQIQKLQLTIANQARLQQMTIKSVD